MKRVDENADFYRRTGDPYEPKSARDGSRNFWEKVTEMYINIEQVKPLENTSQWRKR